VRVRTTPLPNWIRRAAQLASLLALGPVTGPLVALAAVSFRNRRPIVGAPAVLAAELRLVSDLKG
jgi:hypothetical protein